MLALLIICASCHKEDTTSANPTVPGENLGIKGDFKINFNGKFGTDSFISVKAYNYQGVQKVMFSKLTFYITGISLLGDKIVESDKVALIDLGSPNAASKNISLTELPSGHYTGISFTLGVIPALNKKNPADFPSSNPLSLTSYYWDDWESYLFTVIQGSTDVQGKGQFNSYFAILTGANDAAKKLEFKKDITIKEGTPFHLDLDVDVLGFFKEGNTYYDLVNDPLSHNPGDIPALARFAGQMAKAFTMK